MFGFSEVTYPLSLQSFYFITSIENNLEQKEGKTTVD